MSGVIQIVTSSALVVVTIPIFITKLGIDLYGVFTLVSVLGYFNVIANFGFGTSLIKFLSEQGRVRESNFDILATFLFMLAVLIPLGMAAIFGGSFVLRNILHIPDEYLNETTKSCFSFLVVANIIILLGQIPSAVLDASKKVHLTNFLQLGYNIINRGSVIAILLIAPRLDLIGLSILLTTAMWFIGIGVATMLQWQYFEIEGFRSNFVRVIRKHIRYGSMVYSSSLLGLFYEPATKILIGKFIGLGEVVYFDIGLRVKGLLWSIFERFVYPIVPLMASISDLREIRHLVIYVQKKLLIIIVPLIVTICFISHPLIYVWIGKDVQVIAHTTTVITVGYFVALAFLPIYQFLTVKNHPEKTIIIQASNVLVNTGFFFLLVPTMGYVGAVSAFLLALVASNGLCMYYQKKYLENLPLEWGAELAKLLLLGIALCSFDIFIVLIDLTPLVELLLLVLTNVVVSLLVMRGLRLVPTEDIARCLGTGPLRSVLEKVLVR